MKYKTHTQEKGHVTFEEEQAHGDRADISYDKCLMFPALHLSILSRPSLPGSIDLFGGEDVATKEQPLLQSSALLASLWRAAALIFNHLVRCLLNYT